MDPVTEIVQKDGKKYAMIGGVKYRLIRVFECNGCGKEAEGGSEELLNDWSKSGFFDGTESFTSHHCGSCERL